MRAILHSISMYRYTGFSYILQSGGYSTAENTKAKSLSTFREYAYSIKVHITFITAKKTLIIQGLLTRFAMIPLE